MAIFAYTYSDPLLDEPVGKEIWGVEVERVYADFGDRQQLDLLFADIRKNPPDYLLIRRLDELGDSLKSIGDRRTNIEQAGIKIIATEQDYQTQTQENFQQFQALLDDIHQRQISRRIQQGHAKKRHQGLPPPGRTPYGYRRGQDRYLLDRSTAPVIKDFCEYFLLYGSLRGAVRHLEKRFGKKIAVSTGRKWLTNPVYRGHLHYKDGTILPHAHAAILDESEAAQIDRLLRRNRQLPPRSASAPRCLAGLVQCQQCQSPLAVTQVTQRGKRKDQKSYLYLRPQHCPASPKCAAIAYEAVFQATVKRICQDFPKLVATLPQPPLAIIQNSLQQQIQAKQDLIAQLPELLNQGIFDAQTADLRHYKLQGEIAALQTQSTQLPPNNLGAIAKTISLEQFWYDLSEAERRFYLREFVEQIQIQRPSRKNWEIQLKFIFETSFRYTEG